MSRTVGVVVPAYEPNVERLSRYVRALDDRLSPAVIRIELDGAGSGTVDALADLPATVNAVDYRRGKGAAITEGFDALDTDVLAFADADGSTPADSVAAVIAPVKNEKAGLAVGSRRHPSASIASHQKVLRRFLGDGFAWLARRLLDPDLYDYQCGAKAIDAGTWESVRGHLYEDGFAWDIELVAVAGAVGAQIAEVPVVWEDKPESTVSPIEDTVSMFRGLLAAHHRAKLIRQHRLHGLLASRDERRPLVERWTDE
jgi:hypothetical protein